jgi:hypothetical protein
MPDNSASTAAAALAEFEITSSLNPDNAPELIAKKKSFHWCYWRKPDGEICLAPNWPTESVQRMEEGWISLKRYGEFTLQNAGWNVTREPFRLIMANGGAHEFSPAQIVTHNWHRRPPYKGIRFPQLDLEQVADATCKFCRKKFSSYSEDGGLPEARAVVEANLAKHETIAHKENSQNAGLARALKEGLLDPKAAAGLTTEDLTALVRQMADTQASILQLLAAREAPYTPPKPTPPGAVKR